MKRGATNEFPLLARDGLYAAKIRGDGNCLFRALSDQLFGTQDRNGEIRARVIEYMQQHKEHFKHFVAVERGGGSRRNPKRKNAGGYSSPTSCVGPTPEEIEQAFDKYIQTMAQSGTWGDNLEIQAFSSAYGVDVKVYHECEVIDIEPTDSDEENREIVYIAHHTWEHYSSVRYKAGPHTGKPGVVLRSGSPLSSSESPASSSEDVLKEVKATFISSKKIDEVIKLLKYVTDRSKVRRTLQECNGDVALAASKLLDSEDKGSAYSTPGSSSVERDCDSDDDILNAPNKRIYRRRSHAKGKHLTIREKEHGEENVETTINASGPATYSTDSTTEDESSNADQVETLGDETEDEDWRPSSMKEEQPLLMAPKEDQEEKKSLGEPTEPGVTHITTVTHVTAKIDHDTVSHKTQTKDEQKPGGKSSRGLSRRDRIDLKKATQKAAAKQRKQAAASTKKMKAPKIQG